MPAGVRSLYKHSWPVRLAHWLNVLCFFILLGSGLNIFNAHPKLYWGQISTFETPAFSIGARYGAQRELLGVTTVGEHRFITTGVLGVSKNASGVPTVVGFPGWATIPSERNLAGARLWHLFFAWVFVINGLLFWLWAWRAQHYRRDLHPSADDWRSLPRSLWDHLRFRHPQGEAAARYNVLQKLAYLTVICGLLPGLVVFGLCMSPHLDSVLGWLLDLVGGRQSARSLHFIFAGLMVVFIAIHLLMVLVSGPINQIRSMLTGWFRIHEPAAAAATAAPAQEPETKGHTDGQV